jgi:D-alanine-D-alanine ligase
MPLSSRNVAVVFGGRSVEHDVSIITGLQVAAAAGARHRVTPVYVTREGQWLVGDSLATLDAYTRSAPPEDATPIRLDGRERALVEIGARRSSIRRRPRAIPVDVVIPACHGTDGEDGALQGLLQLEQVPYAGSDVAAAAIAMNKAWTKAVLTAERLPTLPWATVDAWAWHENSAAALASVHTFDVGMPTYVKPLRLGSSIGVRCCTSTEELHDALELVFEIDSTAILEPALAHARDINCAVLGGPGTPLRASVCEEPVTASGMLSFDDKYLSGGGKGKGMESAQRIIPAPLDASVSSRIQELACAAFTALRCRGTVRVDFLVAPDGAIYINEVNSIPGSMAFYLWQATGLSFPDLVDELIVQAENAHKTAGQLVRTFASGLLAGAAGVKAGSYAPKLS